MFNAETTNLVGPRLTSYRIVFYSPRVEVRKSDMVLILLLLAAVGLVSYATRMSAPWATTLFMMAIALCAYGKRQEYISMLEGALAVEIRKQTPLKSINIDGKRFTGTSEDDTWASGYLTKVSGGYLLTIGR